MPRISLRISRKLRDSLKEKAANSNMSVSEYARIVLTNAVVFDSDEWMLIAWRLFGVNMDKVRKALSKSVSVADFLSKIDSLSKTVTITPNISSNLDFDFTIDSRTYNVSIEPTGIISIDSEKIIKELDRKILDQFMEDV